MWVIINLDWFYVALITLFLVSDLNSIAFHQDVRDSIPADALLYVYATFFVPLVFSILVGTNIWVWTRNRINYQFIFGMFINMRNRDAGSNLIYSELDVRTQLDSREYFEVCSHLKEVLPIKSYQFELASLPSFEYSYLCFLAFFLATWSWKCCSYSMAYCLALLRPISYFLSDTRSLPKLSMVAYPKMWEASSIRNKIRWGT